MEKDAKYFIVGVFVSLGIVALISFTIWMAGSSGSENYERFTVYFTDPVSGLNEGASVQYKGVQVGKILDIRLAPERKDLIKVDIEVEENTPIRAGTRATLALLGITGMVYMELTTELTDTEPAHFVAGERYPVIQGSGTQLAKLFEDIPQITEQIMEISEKLNGLLNEENMASIDAALINIEKITRDMNGLLSTENVANASIILTNFSESSKDVKVMIERFEETADEIDQAVNAISAVVTKNEASISQFTQEGLSQITAMTREVRKMAESIRETADNLNEDPSQILYQPTYRGVEIAK
ncbi:MAG: MlaD family protein [Micavibrio sp.]